MAVQRKISIFEGIPERRQASAAFRKCSGKGQQNRKRFMKKPQKCSRLAEQALEKRKVT
jgi:hypothetical protein